ncbi:DUF1592 domain-containing protein [Agaribacter flavus]|uniref:DUF1592 domain-containing protein n=1 Tax=Agaribacter flavus TaxID=1902781 RepID=A0ABV7FVG6_9ALTE
MINKFSQKIPLSLVLLAVALLATALLVEFDGQAGDGILRFFGRFHVLVLHFPVTLLLIAPIVWLLSSTKKYEKYRVAVMPLWWLGAISAVCTVTLGILLAANEGYHFQEVRLHMLAGTTVALLALFCTAKAHNYAQQSNLGIRKTQVVLSTSLALSIFIAAHAGGNLVHGETYLTRFAPQPIKSLLHKEDDTINIAAVNDSHYTDTVRPILEKACFDCHGPDSQKGNVRLDNLNPDFVNGIDAPHWHAALDMINSGEMPPKKKYQPSDEDRRVIVDWMTEGIKLAKEAKKGDSQLVMRRLTREQYTNTLQELLGLDIDFGAALPSDPLSAMGFSNSGELLQSSTLHLETFESIARQALDKAINIGDKPQIHHYRMSFGRNKGMGENGTKSTGYLDTPVDPEDFIVRPAPFNDTTDEFEAIKPYFSASMRGSDQRRFLLHDDKMSLYSAKPHVDTTADGQFGAWHGPSPNLSMQIKDQYPREGDFVVRVKAAKGNSFAKTISSIMPSNEYPALVTIKEGQLADSLSEGELSQVAAGVSRFVQVEGLSIAGESKELLLNNGKTEAVKASGSILLDDELGNLYQFDLVHPELAPGTQAQIKIQVKPLKKMTVTLKPTGKAKVGELVATSFAHTFMTGRWHNITITGDQHFPGFSHVVATKLDTSHPIAKDYPLDYFENNIDDSANPVITPYIGTRTDDGMDYKTFAQSALVDSEASKIYTFKGRLENLPIPFHGTVGDHITSSSMKVGLWNDDKIKKNEDKGSVLDIEYIEFEAPYFEQWPTQSHQQIFITSSAPDGSEAYAREVITQFTERAFRRPVSKDDIDPYMTLWHTVKDDFPTFEEGIKETLVAVLSSPNFLFLVEPQSEQANTLIADENDAKESDTPQSLLSATINFVGETFKGIASAHASQTSIGLDEYALANRLSYFLWNSPPDQELLNLAKQGRLSEQLNAQINRMLADDEKLMRFIEVFSEEWLRLDRQQLQSVDVETFPDYTRFVKQDMFSETTYFLKKLIQGDMSMLNMIDSDFAMLNQNLAEFYGIDGVVGHEFRAVSLIDESNENSSDSPRIQRGGLLSQGAFLTGHADGVHSHPVKRAVWLKEKILGDEPPPPPPNVPDLDPETPGFEKLTLKQQLEKHRDKESCRDCHAKIDPFGVVFEKYDAVGRYRSHYKTLAIDASSTLPDGTVVDGVSDIKAYLLSKQPDQVALSFIKHLFSYALGKDVSFHDEDEIQAILNKVKQDEYGMKSAFKHVINSPSFLNSKGAS